MKRDTLGPWYFSLIFYAYIDPMLVGSSVCPQHNENLNNFSKFGQIREIDISTKAQGQAGHDYDVLAGISSYTHMQTYMFTTFLNACMLAWMHTIFLCARANI